MPNFMTSTLAATLGTIFVLAGITGSADAANFTDKSFGISIDIDDALPKQAQVRDVQPFVSQDNIVSLVIRLAYDLTLTDFVDQLRGPGYHDARHQVSLRINGNPIEAKIDSGLGLLIPVQGQLGGQPLRGIIGAYSSNSGHGFLVIGTTRPEYWPQWDKRMKAMFESVKFVEVDTRGMLNEWGDRLKGKKLQPRQTNVTGYGMYYGAAPAPRNYHLCSDGSVKREQASAGQAAGQNMAAYGYGMNHPPGAWTVSVLKSEPFLVVRDGPEQGYKLEYEGNTLLLDGTPYTITTSKLCK